jgi:hypothetical protein
LTGWVDDLRVTKDLARYTVDFYRPEKTAPTISFLPPNPALYQCDIASFLAPTYGQELQYKALVTGENTSFYCTESSIQINASLPGLAGTMTTVTTGVPISSNPMIIMHGLSGAPEILKVTMEVVPILYPASATTPYLKGEEISIESFERAGATTSTALSSVKWDELYTTTIGPSSITVSRNIDDNNSSTGTTSADEVLSFITKDGSRYYATNEAELTASFRLKVTGIKGGINYSGVNDQFNFVKVDGVDNSLFETTSSNGGNTYRYWRVRSQGIKSHHIDDRQIQTFHIADNQITSRTLESITSLVAGTYTYPVLSVDAYGRIIGITSQSIASAGTGAGTAGLEVSAVEAIVHRAVDMYFNEPGGEEIEDSGTMARIGPTGTFNYWTSAGNFPGQAVGGYDGIPDRGEIGPGGNTGLSAIGLYDPYVIKLPTGRKKVKMRIWGAGAGSNTNATPSLSVFHGGAGGYSEVTYSMNDQAKEVIVWIGKGGASQDWDTFGTTGTQSASARPEALSGMIMEQDPLGLLYYDQMHPPGCGGDTFITMVGVSGNPVTILKAYGGGVKYTDRTSYASATADESDQFEHMACFGGTRSPTRVTKTDMLVMDLAGNALSGACTFYTDPFDPGFETAWIAGGAGGLSALSALEHVIGIEMPSTAESTGALTTSPGGVVGGAQPDVYTMNTTTGLTIVANHDHFKTFFTFSSPGEFGNSVYQEVNVCLPTILPAGSPCFVTSQNRASSSFGSNSIGYGAGGYIKLMNDRNVGGASGSPLGGGLLGEYNGRDGGVIIEIL